MTARHAAFRQVDVSRAVKGVKAAGIAVGAVEILPDGRIVVKSKSDDAETGVSALAQWEANRAGKT